MNSFICTMILLDQKKCNCYQKKDISTNKTGSVGVNPLENFKYVVETLFLNQKYFFPYKFFHLYHNLHQIRKNLIVTRRNTLAPIKLTGLVGLNPLQNFKNVVETLFLHQKYFFPYKFFHLYHNLHQIGKSVTVTRRNTLVPIKLVLQV